MGTIEELVNLKNTKQLFYVFIFLTFIQGFLFIFIFDEPLFERLDNFKLIILSCAIVAPFYIFNQVLFENSIKSQKISNEEIIEAASTFSAVSTICIFVVVDLMGFFLILKIKEAGLILIGVEFIFILVMCLILLKGKFHLS